jgi:ABC-type phosphate/phosphonate transport system substrate-binding protein
MKAFILGAVAYDPKVVTIWDGFKQYFEERGLPFDYVLFHNYERQVAAHFAGVVDVAWNSPLAWIQAERIAARTGRRARAVAMRDSDQDLRSVVIVRRDDAARSPADLSGRRVGVGALDSPQATLIPLWSLRQAGMGAAEVARHDVLVGKHGDHVGGERVAAAALVAGEVDAACALDSNLLAFAADGTLPADSVRVLHQTAPYDHCNFTVLDGVPEEALDRFVKLLLGMSWDDPTARRLMDLEGLKAWRPGRTEGYAQLDAACTESGCIDAFVSRVG